MQIDFHTLNKIIADKLDSGNPFSVIRIDNTAGNVIDYRLRNEFPSQDYYNPTSLVEGGIFPNSLEYAYNYVIPPTIKALADADIVGFVDCAQVLQKSQTIIDTYKDKPTFFSHSFLIMDPGALLGLDTMHPYSWGAVEDPWTAHLKGKKVLTISTHCESIKHQWKNIDNVWGANRNKIAPFDLVGTIRSPYHPMMDNRQYPNCNTWHESVEYIKKEIEKYDFDVLLSGVTASSPIYVEHAKKLGKVGIQTGGTLQLFFGILGYRWFNNENNGYTPWQSMANEHWIWPLKEDSAQQRENYKFLETNYAYW